MLISLIVIFMIGLSSNRIGRICKLPAFVFMILMGILCGPYLFSFISKEALSVSSYFKTFALLIILMRSGLGIEKDVLKEVGSSAMLMSILPCLFEGFFITWFAIQFLSFSLQEAGMLGFMIAAVSPAVVVPGMLKILDTHPNKRVPTLILAAASIDDIVAISIFYIFASLNSSDTMQILVQIPYQIILAILLGYLVCIILEKTVSEKTLFPAVMLFSIFLYLGESLLKYNAMLSIMALGFFLKNRNKLNTTDLNDNYQKIWKYACFYLFTFIGAQVQIFTLKDLGILSLVLLCTSLCVRSIGVVLALIPSGFHWKEKLFTILSFIPKATVQAALGSIPLSMGVPHGEMILAISVGAILMTAPLGSVFIDKTYPKLLSFDKNRLS